MTGPDADRFTFYVDALHDRLTGASFEVSAAGAQRDAIISNDTNRDNSWDAVWESAVSIDEEGWIAEMRIPLSQLAIPEGGAPDLGLQRRALHLPEERARLARAGAEGRERPGVADGEPDRTSTASSRAGLSK